jgi:hypothetical protein
MSIGLLATGYDRHRSGTRLYRCKSRDRDPSKERFNRLNKVYSIFGAAALLLSSICIELSLGSRPAYRSDTPNGVRQIVTYDQRAARIEGDADRTPTCLAVRSSKSGHDIDGHS